MIWLTCMLDFSVFVKYFWLFAGYYFEVVDTDRKMSNHFYAYIKQVKNYWKITAMSKIMLLKLIVFWCLCCRFIEMTDSDDIQPIVCDFGTGMVKVSIIIILFLFHIYMKLSWVSCILVLWIQIGINACLGKDNIYFFQLCNKLSFWTTNANSFILLPTLSNIYS